MTRRDFVVALWGGVLIAATLILLLLSLEVILG